MNQHRLKSFGLLLFASTFLSACNLAPTLPLPSPTLPSQQPLGVVQVQVSGVGSQTPQVKATFVPSSNAFSSQSFSVYNPNTTPVAFPKAAISFYDDLTSGVNTRYLTTILDVINNSTTAFDNLTLVALDYPSISQGGSAVGQLLDATGSAVSNPALAARAFLPTHAMKRGFGKLEVDSSLAHLQVFTLNEVSSLQNAFDTAFPSVTGESLLGYGYVAQNLGGGRALQATGCAPFNCNRGQVALSYKFERTALNRAQEPWSFTLTYALVNDTIPTISQSLEEQSDNAAVSARVGGVGAIAVRTLGGSSYSGGNTLDVGGARVAVPSSPTYPQSVWLGNIMASDPGSLDLTFGTLGKVTTDFGSSNDIASSVAIQSDGKMVVAGYSHIIGVTYDFAVVRYNTDGSLDTSFGTLGKVTTDFGSLDDFAYSVVIQSDGKIVVAGGYDSGANYDFAVVRYNTNGSLDTSFGTLGKVTTDFGSFHDQANSVAIQSDGKIVLAGYSNNNGGIDDFAAVRYNTNGSLDTSFGTMGKVITDFGSSRDTANSVAIQSDGKIVLAGYSTVGGNTYDFAVVRYNTNGSLDTSFDSDGKVTTDFGVSQDIAHSVAIQSNGKIVVTGFNNFGGTNTNDFAVVRYNTNGSLDTSFGTLGKVTTDFGSSNDVPTSLAIQSDGKIVVAGSSSYNNSVNTDFVVVRYNTNGSLDTSFDFDGKVTTDFGSRNDGARSLAIQSDGKIVVTGITTTIGSSLDFAVVRYNP
jgi:uncharacterized delta-60 repeat protein